MITKKEDHSLALNCTWASNFLNDMPAIFRESPLSHRFINLEIGLADLKSKWALSFDKMEQDYLDQIFL